MAVTLNKLNLVNGQFINQDLFSKYDSNFNIIENIFNNDVVVNVKQFGAKGDGITDDTSAIQSALDYAGTINANTFLPKGSYLISNSLILKGTKAGIIGYGTLLLSTINAGIKSSSNMDLISIKGIIFDGGLYGTYSSHYDEIQGIMSINISAKVVNIENNIFQNIYGTGIQCAGVSTISNNTFKDVAGFNPTTDAGGVFDNYGDGIHLIGANSKGSIISCNYLVTSNVGRAGIVIEYNPTAIIIEGNYMSGYNRGIHLENCGRVSVISNYCDNCTTALLLSSVVAKVEYNIFKDGLTTNLPLYNYGVIYGYDSYSGSIFRGNYIEKTSNAPKAIQFSGGESDIILADNTVIGGIETVSISNFTVTNNKLTNCSFNNNPATAKSKFNNNRFIDSVLIISGSNDVEVKNNHFEKQDSTFNNIFLLTYSLGGNVCIKDNVFNIPGTPTTSYIIDSYLGTNARGTNFFSNNVVNTDGAIQLFRYNTNGTHQPFFVNDVNYMIDSSLNRTVLTFTSKYGNSGNKGEISYLSAIPTSGTYRKSDVVYNTSPSSGGYIGWVCTTAGIANNTAWVASTVYTVGQLVNANGEVYQCTVAGTSGTTAPSHTSGTATDGTVTWQCMGVLAVFKGFGLIAN